jgi:hypothetical protein
LFKFISEDSVLLTYGKWSERDQLTFHFNKELHQVDVTYHRFELNEGCTWEPQSPNKYSCKYGVWRYEAPTLSMEDIEFLHNKAKELWGQDHPTEKGDR